MKKSLLLLGALISASSSLNAQTIFSENFNAGTALPTGWKQYNVDGKTPANAISFMGTDAWKVRAGNAAHGNIITSTSFYTPVGASNDWLVTPAIAVPASGDVVVEYDIQGQDPDYLDSYEVYISTTGNTVADFTGTPALQAVSTAEWTTRSVSLSGFLGQSVYIAFRNNSNDMFLLNMDNVVVRTRQANDVKVISTSVVRYSQLNVNNTLSFKVRNQGPNAITSLSVNWNDGTDHTSTITTNIAPGAVATINHPTSVASATVLEKNITVTALQVNGAADTDPSNNTATTKFSTLSAVVEKNVFIEEGTGTWCQYCPRGAVAMEYMYDKYPNRFIGVAVHNGDPMTVTAYDDAVDLSGYPGCNVDRVLRNQDVSIDAFETYYNDRKDLIVPAEITGSFALNGSSVAITAKAIFKTVMTNTNYRLAAIITEDHVTGTSSGYNQANAFAGGSTPMGGYESLPDPVPAAQMVYDHVGRALLGGYDGQAGSVPTTVADGMEVTYTFNYTVPATSTRANMKAVIILIDQTNGEVINAKAVALTSAGISETVKTIDMNVYPNPASDVLNISFTAENKDYVVNVIDLQGRVVKTQEYTNLSGAQAIQLPVNGMVAGNYLISISTADASYTQHVVIK